jgi:hypothetical protein
MKRYKSREEENIHSTGRFFGGENKKDEEETAERAWGKETTFIAASGAKIPEVSTWPPVAPNLNIGAMKTILSLLSLPSFRGSFLSKGWHDNHSTSLFRAEIDHPREDHWSYP